VSDINKLIDAIEAARLTGDGIDPFAALTLVAEIKRLRTERDSYRASLTEISTSDGDFYACSDARDETRRFNSMAAAALKVVTRV
jgi:hypothetical protein